VNSADTSESNSVTKAGNDSSRRVLAIILAVIGVLAIVAGILYVAGTANSLHFMVGKVHRGHHQIRAIVAFVIGVVLLAAAYFAARPTLTSRR
jgi:uncharacterized membrane protein YidH (DUF202 family)